MSVIPDPAAGVPRVLAQLLSADPGRPRVTWYGPDAERVELSAKTLDNWIAKTANLLVDELDAGPGVPIGLALPPHWRSVVWVLAGWTVGAHVLVLDEGPVRGSELPPSPLDVLPVPPLAALVTDRPSAPPPGVEAAVLVVQPLPALATRFAGDVPSGALDAAVEVRLQPDHFPGAQGPAPFDPAFSVAGGETPVGYGELVGRALADAPLAGPASPARLLTGAGPAGALGSYLGPLAVGGSVVVHHDLRALGEAELAHLIEQENITTVG